MTDAADHRASSGEQDLIRKLTLAVDQSPASVLITDLRGTIEYVNARFEEVTGYTRAQAIGANPRMLSSGNTPRATYEAMWTSLRAGRPWKGEIENRRCNGETYWDQVTISPLRDDQGHTTHYVAVQENITERRKHLAELRTSADALAASERRLRTLLEAVNLFVLVLDLDGRVEYMNPFALALTGWTRDEVIGHDWFSRFLPDDDRAAVSAVLDETLHAGRHAHHRNPVVTRGGVRRMIAWHNTVLSDETGRPSGTLSVGEDVTERDLLEEQLRQAQKMEAVGRLAGGVAHDFNNLLTVIISYGEMLRDHLSPGDERLGDVEPILAAAHSAAGLTRQLLAFSRQQVIRPRTVVLEDLVSRSAKLLRRVIGEDIALEMRLDAANATVVIDPGQFDQVIMNLAVNARDAMPRGGTLGIETAVVELDGSYVETHFPATEGRFVRLSMSDTGTGMDADTRARIFEPFFTTKEEGRGTGLGLATVYGIVKQSNGFIWVYSEPGLGTTFRIYLPAEAGADVPVITDTVHMEVPSGTETILLVEDAAAVRTVARKLLEGCGYRVIEATSAAEAVEVGERHAGPIDLLLTDVVMPGMGGRDLAEAFLLLRPATRVLYMSGYTDDSIVRHGVLQPGINYLQKPFTRELIARAVRDVLDG